MRRLAVLLFGLMATPAAAVTLTGVNLAGAEFGGINGVFGTNYIYPNEAEMRAFKAMGMNVFRVPVRWERLQPTLSGGLAAGEMARLDKVITFANSLGITVIIDVHNYGRYARQPIGSPEVPRGSLRDLWERLALRYKANPQVIFGLMNEPVRTSANDWAAEAQDSLDGIRARGATNLVLVPGAYWSGAHSWTKVQRNGQSNGLALASMRDPANNFAFDMHQYFDGNSSGTSVACITPEKAEARLAGATAWLRANNQRAMLTEFGVSRDPACVAVLETVLRHMADNPEWLGWTAWASSAWFGSYAFNLYPLLYPVPPQLETLKAFVAQ